MPDAPLPKGALIKAEVEVRPARWIPPWSGDQTLVLNCMQASKQFHGYTCPGEMATCKGQRKLIATHDGWLCWCGKYRQAWAHAVPDALVDHILSEASDA